jgi:tetratricopeptide (TPR) repeat protein
MTGRHAPLVLAAAAMAFVAAIAIQNLRDRAYPRELRETERLLYVRSGPAMRRLALSYDALAADVYWFRAVQHYGGDRLTRGPGWQRYELLYPLLDLTTSLDPYFTIAYRFGAIFLSEPYPGGAGRPDQAVALLRKGIAAQPAKWQYYHDTAFVYYWHLRDYAAAAAWFQRAAGQPGAPNWLAPVAASMLARGGDRTSARFLWQQILESDQTWLRRTAERSLLQLDAMERIDQIQAVIDRNSLLPNELYSWEALTRRGILRGVPLDPTYTAFAIDPLTGRVTVSERSTLFPMPDDRSRAGQ